MGFGVDYFGIGSSKIQVSAMAHHCGWEGDYLQLYILGWKFGGDTFPSSCFYQFPCLDYYLRKRNALFNHYVSDILSFSMVNTE